MREIAALAAMALALGACKERAAKPPPAAQRAAERPEKNEQNRQHAAIVSRWLARNDSLPKRVAEKRCPDDAIQRETTDLTLLTRVEDARAEKRWPLPLRITRPLSSIDLGELESRVARNEVEPVHAAELGQLATRRYVGAFHVIDYATPKRIHRVGRIKPEWVPGWLSAWLVVHRVEGGEPLCATFLSIRNETRDAPLSFRLRSETQERLTGELASALHAAAPAALKKISNVLALGESPPRT